MIASLWSGHGRVDQPPIGCYNIAPADVAAGFPVGGITIVRMFLPVLFGALVLASAVQAEPTRLPQPESLLSAQTPVEFTKWKAKHWNGRYYGGDRRYVYRGDRGHHYGWYNRPYRRPYYRIYR
jgi:hypothetical protein